MNELEYLKEQLAEMQRENAALREALNRKKHNDAYPDEVLSKFPLVWSQVGRNPSYQSGREYRLEEQFTQRLSYIIRSTVFGDTASTEKRRKKLIPIQDMDSDEYELWLDTLEGVLSALEAGCKRRDVLLCRRSENDVLDGGKSA